MNTRQRGDDAVAISTPAATHYDLVCKALQAGKHVLVEKPFTVCSRQAQHLIELSQQFEKTLMVGHVFEYNSTVWALKEIIDSGELGELYYLNFERTNLGPVRTDVNALWDLASHDISIMYYLLGESPVSVSARGQAFLNEDTEDIVHATFDFSRTLAHVHASWLHPQKVREITAVGSRKMAIWNDLDLQKPICIFDKHIAVPEQLPDSFHAYKTAPVDGGMEVPAIECNQPLQAECDHFLECVRQGTTPRTDGENGLRVVRALEAAAASMQENGRTTPIALPESVGDTANKISP